MRTSTIQRNTTETRISLLLNLDGKGESKISTGVGFLDHMLTLFARHGQFDLELCCQGDTHIDDHHSVEDIGICLGQALKEALGEKRGIVRYGHIILPMDEALILCAVDISGRSVLRYRAAIPSEKVGTFDTELVVEFMRAFAMQAGINLHIQQLDGENSHHIIEGMFKALGRALAMAVKIDAARAGEIPSTKGVLA